MKYHKKIRLDKEIYNEEHRICSITVCAIKRRKIFVCDKLNSAIITLIKKHSANYEVAIYAYCLMPDHLHLLIMPSAEKSIIDFVRDVKSLSTKIAWENGINGRIWQKSFYDHFIRKEENIRNTIEYILDNPVRQGIVKMRSEYKYSGSMVYDL